MNSDNGFKTITIINDKTGEYFSNKLQKNIQVKMVPYIQGGSGTVKKVIKNSEIKSVVKLPIKIDDEEMKYEIDFYENTVKMICKKIDYIYDNNSNCEDSLDNNIKKYIDEEKQSTKYKNSDEKEKKKKIKKNVFKKVLENDIKIARPKGLVKKDDLDIGIILEKGTPLNLSKLPKSVQKRQKITHNFLKSLQNLHNYHMCIEDIKPDNLLLNNNGNLIFCDFNGSFNIIHNKVEIFEKQLYRFVTTPLYNPKNNVKNEMYYYALQTKLSTILHKKKNKFYSIHSCVIAHRQLNYYAAIVTFFDIVSGSKGSKYRDKLDNKIWTELDNISEYNFENTLLCQLFNALLGNEKYEYQNVEAKNIFKLVKFGVSMDVIIKNYVEGKLDNTEIDDNQIVNFMKKEMGIKNDNNNFQNIQTNQKLVEQCVQNTGNFFQSKNHYLQKVKKNLYTGSDALINSYNVQEFHDKYEAVKLKNSMIKATSNKGKRGAILKAGSMLELLDIALHKKGFGAVMDKFIKKVQSNEKLTKMLKDEITKMKNQNQNQEITNLLDYADAIANKQKFTKDLNEFAEGCAKAAAFNAKQCKPLILFKNQGLMIMQE